MSSALPTIPLICAAILCLFVPVRRVRESVVKLALVAWLLGCNFVHGINAIVWFSSTEAKSFIWCDIVTKLTPATAIAIPAACACVSYRLEYISSSRKLLNGPKFLKNRRLFEAFCCYLIPLLYMPLLIIAQNHRFDIIEGFGCLPAFHPSTPASLVVWLPPFLISVMSLIFCGLSVHHTFRTPEAQFASHLESRSSMTAPIFMRELAASLVMTIATMIVIIFSMFSLPMFDTWQSWEHVHELISEVHLVTQEQDVKGVQAMWWGLRILTIVYIIVIFILGEEVRDIARRIAKVKRPSFPSRHLFVKWTPRRRWEKDVPPLSPSLSTPLRPVTIELKSGWDDDLNATARKSYWFKRGNGKSSLGLPPSPSPSPSTTSSEDSFMKAAMTSFGPPMGQAFGMSTPVLPPPVYKSPVKKSRPYVTKEAANQRVQQNDIDIPNSPKSSSTQPLHRERHESLIGGSAVIASVLQEHWPLPPISLTPSSGLNEYDEMVSPTRASSPALSIRGRQMHGSSCYSQVEAEVFQPENKPFEGSSVRSLSPTPVGSIQRAPTSRRRPSLRGLHGIGKEKRGQSCQASNDVIHMTVVQETV